MSKKAALVALSALLSLLLAELGYRTWLAVRGAPHSAAATEESLLRLQLPLAGFVPGLGTRRAVTASAERPILLLHPYTGSDAGIDPGGALDVFQHGTPPGQFTVLVLGGSVAAGFVGDMQHVFPEMLERDARLAGRDVALVGYVFGAYKQPQQVMRLAYLFEHGYRPDAVINIDGFNELALAHENAGNWIHPLFPTYSLWGALVGSPASQGTRERDLVFELWKLRREAGRLIDRSIAWNLCASSLYDRWIRQRMARLVTRRAVLQRELQALSARVRSSASGQRASSGPAFDPDEEGVLDLCVKNWFESSISLAALCHSRGIPYLHVLQPALHDVGSKPLSEKERALLADDHYRTAVSRGYPRLRARGHELAQHGVGFFDASRVFESIEVELYYDPCHFVQSGNRLLALAIAPQFLANLRSEPAPR